MTQAGHAASPSSRAAASGSIAASIPRSPTPTSTCRRRSATSRIRSPVSARRRSRCAARSRWRTTSTTRSASSARARRCARSIRFRPGVAGHDPALPQHDPLLAAARQRAARPLRLPQGARWLSHPARRQAARHSLFVDPDRARPAVRRAHEALARLDRHPARDPQGPLSRSSSSSRTSAG